MCRLAAFPPGFSKKEASKILSKMEETNLDGVGSVYTKDNNFVVNKWPKSFSWVMGKGLPLLSHMPYDGWTIVHLRNASHGDNRIVNTHPFVVKNWAVVHNGIWSEYDVVKLALSKSVEFKGETDSEVAAHLLNIVGPKRFANGISFGGVFMALYRNGGLWVIKTSGSLEGFRLPKKKFVLASEFFGEEYKDSGELPEGWYYFDKTGRVKMHKDKKFINFNGGDDDEEANTIENGELPLERSSGLSSYYTSYPKRPTRIVNYGGYGYSNFHNYSHRD